MAEEDEVDILGDCSLDSFLSKNETIFDTSPSTDLVKCDDSLLVSQNSDLLKCDYTIHPQWLLDKPSTNPACWYSTSDSEFSSDIPSQSEILPISSENSITDESGWTEKEKNLLCRGIEIFGKSNVRLSQFIGSKSSSEVKYYLKNFYSDLKSFNNSEVIYDNYIEETVVSTENSDLVINKEILDEAEIPASIEEVIAAVSTAKPTVVINNNIKNKSSNTKLNYYDIPSGHSLLKRYYFKENIRKTESRIRKQRTKLETKKSNLKQRKTKFRTKVDMVRNKKKKNIYDINRKTCASEVQVDSGLKSSDVEIVTGNGLSVPVCNGEEVVKIKKENDASDSDIEIDIVDSDNEIQSNTHHNIVEEVGDTGKKEFDTVNTKLKNNQTNDLSKHNEKSGIDNKNNDSVEEKKVPDLTELCEADINFLKSTDFPDSEYNIEREKISDLEKFIHYEFFEGRPTKTPVRYLKIRNHILDVWKNIKPAYVTKTSIRQGLRQCGDVNCIGRIHHFLEQIGAINFNCQQTNYVRPLYELVFSPNAAVKEKSKESQDSFAHVKHEMYYRNRNKKKYINDGEGGCTLQHNESGEVINTTVINEDPIIKKPYIKRPIIRLIYCKPFNDSYPQEYKIRINLTPILLMDLHAHVSLSEVMGLVGGHWNHKTKVLTITRYEPCKNVAASSMHCDMCPLSQAKAADILHGENLNILGWFHSHPTFAPEPSQQDIDTQLSVQQWIGHGRPCIGIILSPFSSHGALIASPYRCMIVRKKENVDDQFVPYKLNVDVNSSNLCVEDLLMYAKRIFNYNYDESNSGVDFSKPYFQDTSITYLKKFISSINMHLAKSSDISKMTCDEIIQGLSVICSSR